MTWVPTSEELKSIRAELEAIPEDGYWVTPDNFAQYRRDGTEDRLVLVRRVDAPEVAGACGRVEQAASLIGWEVDDDDAELVAVPMHDPVAAEHELRLQMQEALMKFTCANEDCDTPLFSMDLEAAVWRYMEAGEDGEELWCPVVSCYSCETEIPMMAEHYQVLAGDELAATWNTHRGVTYRVLNREEVIKGIDEKEEGLSMLGTVCPLTGEIVPYPYRGFMVRASTDEEE